MVLLCGSVGGQVGQLFISETLNRGSSVCGEYVRLTIFDTHLDHFGHVLSDKLKRRSRKSGSSQAISANVPLLNNWSPYGVLPDALPAWEAKR